MGQLPPTFIAAATVDFEEVGVGETEDLTVGLTSFTPLLHTSLVPDLIQVYLIPAETVVDLSLLQVVPVLATALAGVMIWNRKSEAQIEASRQRFIGKL